MGVGAGVYDNAAARWAGVGPYYAMFPIAFADGVIKRYTSPGDMVLDPFAGRGTAVFSAAVASRHGVGIELNPVGWVYSRAKIAPASQEEVEQRLKGIDGFTRSFQHESHRLPIFYRYCFTARVRRFLLAARARLDWRRSPVDRTLMALILVHLHGKREAALSNQMRQTKSMAPEYSVRWWRMRHKTPPDIDPVEFLTKRLDWRYARGTPSVAPSLTYLGDSSSILPSLGDRLRAAGLPEKAALLFTSPPYFGVTNYHYDQWLRLWMLGGPAHARRVGIGHFRNRFEHQERYRSLLYSVFSRSKPLMKRGAVLYVRTDSRKFTYNVTREVLREIFGKKEIRRLTRPFDGPTQTQLFGDKSEKTGEIDLVLT